MNVFLSVKRFCSSSTKITTGTFCHFSSINESLLGQNIQTSQHAVTAVTVS